MIDLHMHTIYSDGSKSVEELLKMCEEKKLEYISITDHDTCKQYNDEEVKRNLTMNEKGYISANLYDWTAEEKKGFFIKYLELAQNCRSLARFCD